MNRKICCTILLSYTLYTDYMFPSIDKILMSYSFKKSQQEGATNSILLLNTTFLYKKTIFILFYNLNLAKYDFIMNYYKNYHVSVKLKSYFG